MRMQGTRCKMQDSRCKIQDVKVVILNTMSLSRIWEAETLRKASE